MKAFLMYQDRDFSPAERPCPNAGDLEQDLELDTLFKAMAAGDDYLLKVARAAVLQSIGQPDAILYRQRVLADCIEHPDVVRAMYSVAVEAVEREKRNIRWTSPDYPIGTLHRSIDVLKIFLELLKKLRTMAVEQGGGFRSDGFQRLFTMFEKELGDEYVKLVESHLERLAFRKDMLMSAELGQGNRGVNYILRKSPQTKSSWTERVQSWLEQVGRRNRSSFVFEIADRDEGGFRALSDLRNQGIAHVAGALAQSTDHLLGFFRMLRAELGFYVGCLNLRDRLVRQGGVSCFPEPVLDGSAQLAGKGLYDVCLSLNLEAQAVGNDIAADGMSLVIITGANRGGKSTFLRSVGVAQLMMQCGMFVPAERFRANVCQAVFTHFKREEDAAMKSGKLDEELMRMSRIIDELAPSSLILFNESFAATNEREGSEIARQIVRALLDGGMKVFFVTHMFSLAQGFHRQQTPSTLFLRAERLPSGLRTFRVVPGEPLPTSFGKDLFERIFEIVPEDPPAAPARP